jgi:EF hand
MRFQRLGLSVAMGLLIACPVGIATGQDEPPPAQGDSAARPERARRAQNPEFRQRMLDEFDLDGNGQLDETERQAMRQQMRERREQMRERFGPGPNGPPPPGDRPQGAADRRGPGGPPPGAGRDGPSPLEGLFPWFDSNHDNQLSREEFGDLARFVQQRRLAGRPGGGPEGRGFGRRGPGGPPPGEGFGRGGPRGRGPGDGPPGRRGPGGPPPRAEDGGPPPQENSMSQPAADEAAADDST